MSAAVWAVVLPLVVMIIRQVVTDIMEQRRIERDRRDTD